MRMKYDLGIQMVDKKFKEKNVLVITFFQESFLSTYIRNYFVLNLRFQIPKNLDRPPTKTFVVVVV